MFQWIQSILCWFGFHKWSAWGSDTWFSDETRTRYCNACGEIDIMDWEDE